VLLAVIGAIAVKRPGRAALWLLRIGAFGIFWASWPPAGRLASRLFERPYPPALYPAANDAQAIVVLPSAVYPAVPQLPTARVGSDTYERCLYAAWLHLHWRPLPILACGGTNHSGMPPYSITLAKALEYEGVPRNQIWLEEESHTTHENAVYAARLLRAKGIHRIVLVTDAYHMFRAERSFRRQGLDVVPAACAHRSYFTLQLTDVFPSWEPIGWTEDLLHESLGLLWYRLHSWI
jgi:uncharacterized SAM-binding protein YcdF (DUF218 family)